MPGTIRPNPLMPDPGTGVPSSAPSVQLPGRGLKAKSDVPSPMEQSGPGAPPVQASGPDPVGQIVQKNKGLEEQFKKLQESDVLLKKVVSGLLDLAELGDTITPQDVTKKASSFVAAGLGAKAVAGLLASMPLNSQEALASWVGQLGLQAAARKQAVDLQMGIIGHELAKSGVQLLMVSDAQTKMQSGQLKPMPTGKVLVPPGGKGTSASSSAGVGPPAAPSAPPSTMQ